MLHAKETHERRQLCFYWRLRVPPAHQRFACTPLKAFSFHPAMPRMNDMGMVLSSRGIDSVQSERMDGGRLEKFQYQIDLLGWLDPAPNIYMKLERKHNNLWWDRHNTNLLDSSKYYTIPSHESESRVSHMKRLFLLRRGLQYFSCLIFYSQSRQIFHRQTFSLWLASGILPAFKIGRRSRAARD